MTNQKNQNYDWSGWPIDNNPYGQEFDLAARKRMVKGSQRIMPFIRRHEKDLGDVILEVGPFFNPLILPEEFEGKTIFYWENDHYVLEWLSREYSKKKVFPIYCDLNKIEGDSFLKLKMQTQKYFKEAGIKNMMFDSVVISHVFNYTDYKLFLMVLKDFVKKDGLVFINNVVDYGLPPYFSRRRPKSIQETLRTLRETGYDIVERRVYESPDKRFQKNKRLIVVARNI